MPPLDLDDLPITEFLAAVFRRMGAWILVAAFRAVLDRCRTRR